MLTVLAVNNLQRVKRLKNNILQIIRHMGCMEIFVQSIHDRHIFILNVEIKNIGVGSNAVWIDGFRNYRNTLLDCPAKTDLSRSMCGRIWCQGRTLHHCQGKHLWQAAHKPEPEFLPTGNIQSVLSDSKADDIRSG